jgi:hypothetical protein
VEVEVDQEMLKVHVVLLVVQVEVEDMVHLHHQVLVIHPQLALLKEMLVVILVQVHQLQDMLLLAEVELAQLVQNFLDHKLVEQVEQEFQQKLQDQQ